jgi:biopolymer transport protein ExbD
MASHADNGEFGFQIAPMLDVLFVLLLFFMVSAGVQKQEARIITQLPGQTNAPGPQVRVNLEITAEGQVIFNGVAVDSTANHELPETMARLQAVVADAPDRPVIITPAPSTRQQRVVDVLNACKAAHIRNIAFGSPSD